MDAKDRIIEQRMARRRRDRLIVRTIIAFLLILIVFLAVILIRAGITQGLFAQAFTTVENLVGIGGSKSSGADQGGNTAGSPSGGADGSGVSAAQATESTGSADAASVLSRAQLLAAQYDYQGAIDLIRAQDGYDTNTDYQNAVASYQTQKDACVAYPIDQITHVFFHTLIYDTSKAFDGDGNQDGYNQVMTTISEFNSIIQQMYDRGYVMVSLHDMCEVKEDGSVVRKEIRLPEGKIPFVLSQDDVSYYHYMDGDGFAQKLIVDDNGEVKNTYLEDDGSISVGDYDMVPLIDTFVKEHPDFSYHGHKGIIALTGYEGVLGYRTDEVYKTRQADRLTTWQSQFLDSHPDFDFDQEVADATAVANAMKAEGWEFASHTWGHINPRSAGIDRVKVDTQRWLENVAPIVGSTDVLIFAFGADIGDWTPYTSDNEYFTYYKSQGFSIFCNVDGSQKYWVQFGDNYMRQGRRNLDGYRMYYNPDLVSDLFDVDQAWDSSRPTPVPQM